MHAFRSHDANFLRIHFDTLGECAQVIATVAAALGPRPLARLPGEGFGSLRCDAPPEPFNRILGSLCVSAALREQVPRMFVAVDMPSLW